MRKLIIASLVIGLTASGAQSAEPGASVTVDLSNFKFSPSAIHLRAGVPVVLHLHNSSSGGHSFSAPKFFSAANLNATAVPLVHEGIVEVPKKSVVDLVLVPAAGHYALKCTHTLHSAFGMKGDIIVD